MKQLVLIVFIFSLLTSHFSQSQVDEKRFQFMIKLINEGDYEDALQSGKRNYKKYQHGDPAMFCIAASLMSKASYHWYQFKQSDSYFEKGMETYKTWNNLNNSRADKFIAGLYMLDLSIQRNDWISARELLNSMPIPSDTVKPSNKAKFFLMKSKVLSAYGDYRLALDEIENGFNLEAKIVSEESQQTANEFVYYNHVEMANILLGYGWNSEVDSAIVKINQMLENEKVNGRDFEFAKKLLEAKFSYSKRRYNKASSEFLDAYNILDCNTEEYRKYEALKMAAIASIKAGTVAEYQKLFRRSDMLAFKKPMKSQTFRPGVVQLKLIEFLETGQYKIAIDRANEVNKIYAFLPRNSPYFREFLELKATAAEAEGDLKGYAAVLDTLEIISEKYFGVKSLKYATVKLRKAEYQWKYGGNLSEALNSYKEYYDGYISRKIFRNSPQRIGLLEGYSHLYEYLDRADSALTKTLIASDLVLKTWGKKSPEANYFTSLTASQKFNTGNYKDAIQTLTFAYESNRAIKNDETGYLAKACFLQASLFEWLGEFAKMDEQVDKAYRLSLQKEEKKFYEKFEVSEQLARAYTVKSNFFRAERNLQSSLNDKKERVGNDGYILVDPVLEAAKLKIQKGDLREAEKYLEDASRLVGAYFTKTSERYAKYLFQRAKYYAEVSDDKKAMDLIQQSIDINAKVYGSTHVRLAPLYAELAHIYVTEHSPALADQTYEKAKKIVLDALGKQSPSYAYLQVQQAELQVQMAMYDKATINLDEAEKFWTPGLGNMNVNTAGIFLIRGDMFYAQKKYNDADKNYRKAASQYATIFNKKHSGYLKACVGIAKIAYQKKDYNQAAELMEDVLDERIRYTVNNFSIMSFSQKTNFWAGFREEFEFYYASAYKMFPVKNGLKKAADVYNYAIRTKGLLMTSDAKVRRQVFQSGDSVLVATFNEWLSQKEYFAMVSYYSASQLTEENISIEKIVQTIEELEKKINAKTDIDLSANSREVSWMDVKKSISNLSVAVEMVRFRQFNHTFTDTVIYLGLLIDAKSKDAPSVVVMEDGKGMEGKYLKYYRNATYGKLDNENSFDAYLAPIKSRIPNGYTIFFSGEGVYTQINPEMLYNNVTNNYAFENNDFVFVTNTRDLIPENGKKTPRPNTDGQYYLYGNPKFYTETGAKTKEIIPSLVGAEKEISDIMVTLQSQGKNAVHMIGSNVTEDTLRALQNPSVFHISTHGYFMERKSEGNEMLNNPMLNSGLLLSGSGNILADENGGYINREPGILTASEVMDLNFSKTNLVVLSACETGRGQVEVGEGVYGLQRAFLVAGAKAIILSLFKVDDAATSLLMAKFYERFLKNGGDYRTAFKEAKLELKNSEQFKSPIFWGAFIMIEGHPGKNVLN